MTQAFAIMAPTGRVIGWGWTEEQAWREAKYFTESPLEKSVPGASCLPFDHDVFKVQFVTLHGRVDGEDRLVSVGYECRYILQ